MIRDYVYRIHGDCIRAGYAYMLLGALKTADLGIAEDKRVFFGPIENVKPIQSGILGIRQNTIWRCRAPSELQPRLSRLCGIKLLLGNHVIQLGTMFVEDLIPSPVIHAEFISIGKHIEYRCSDPTHQEFLGWVTDKLRERYSLRDALVRVGRKRKLYIGENRASTGYALAIYGLGLNQSLDIQTDGIGGRRHMGASMFLPGQLPRHVEGEDDTLFSIAPKDWHRKKQRPKPDMDPQYCLCAALFMTAVNERKNPDSKWLARQTGISRTLAERYIVSFMHDLGLPFKYNTDMKGFEPCQSTNTCTSLR
jgi:CRISPR-associated protein Cas6